MFENFEENIRQIVRDEMLRMLESEPNSNELQIEPPLTSASATKILLLTHGLSFRGMALKLAKENSASARSLEVMIADLLYGRRWYPTLAEQLKEVFNISVTCPKHFEPIRKQMEKSA